MTRSLRQTAASAFAFTALVAGAMFTSVPAAQAAGCSGTRIDTMRMSSIETGAKKAGRVELWYSRARGGTNCVIVYDNRPGRHRISAMIARDVDEWDRVDSGRFEYYAGPVKLTNMDGRCVTWGGEMTIGGLPYVAYEGASHCR